MVEPVGREYNRRLSADDDRNALCEASYHDLPSSLDGASRLDDWLQNGAELTSEPRYAVELFSHASAAPRPAGVGGPSAERVVVSDTEVDNLVRGLAAARNTVSADEFHRFVSKNAPVLTEVLRPFGYQGCRRTPQASIDDFDRAYSAWSARNADKARSMPSVGPPPQQASVEEDAAARQQMWHAAANDPIAAAFIGAGALASATVGRLFGFEQDPRRAAAGGQMTSILVHTAGGAGANRAIDSEPVPIELQRAPRPRGTMGASSPIVRGGLEAHEAKGGHLLEKHVEQPLVALEARLRAEPERRAVSTFVSRAEAEAAISSVMAQRAGDIERWVAKGANGTVPFDGAFTGGTVLLRRPLGTVEGRQARVVLHGNGRGEFIILTGFPLP